MAGGGGRDDAGSRRSGGPDPRPGYRFRQAEARRCASDRGGARTNPWRQSHRAPRSHQGPDQQAPRVESRPRTGTKVRAAEDWNILDPDVLVGGSRRRHASSWCASSSSFAGSWNRRSPRAPRRRRREQDIEALTAAYAAMETAADDSERFIGPDADFHKTIVRSVENRMVDALGNVIEAALTLSLKLSLDAPEGQRPSLPLHKKVLDAIRRHDRNGASRGDGASDRQRAAGCAEGARRERVPSPRKRRSA